MASSATVDIPSQLLEQAKRFRMRKTSLPQGSASVMVFKIDKKSLSLQVEEEFDSIPLDELSEELPENSPRFLLVTYELVMKDGRLTFPMFIIYWSPQTSSMDQSTLYASSLSNFSVKVDVSKVISLRDGEVSKDLLDSHFL
ncbi:glia maturation factor beta [Violaceomyces palustris]|uniref:Glia maturation factor beta n=1 Tax=Violaceomyces palustris TaxID=1673888 RepID=A0ACD0P7J9_9BASI|nr:glia maturation factor beta [Violaceomyces palustris]